MQHKESTITLAKISCYEDLKSYAGRELGVSDYLTITQEQINTFADASIDHQWINTDPGRAARELPFKRTMAHGFLTVSLLTYLCYSMVDEQHVKMIVNYGVEKLRIRQPVLVNQQIRARLSIKEVRNLHGLIRVKAGVVVEIKGSKKPALTALLTFLYQFDHS